MKNTVTSIIQSLLLTFLVVSPLVTAQLEDDENQIILLSEDQSFPFELLVPLTEVFWELANQTQAQAEDPEIAYDTINVRDSWFSTATYFRRADFYLHGNPDNPLINYFWSEQTAAFDKAMAVLPVPGQRLQIPADNFTVEALWFPVSNSSDVSRPTIILGNGYDGAQEDLYHTFVVPAHARGWNAITYEGPGQPKVRRDTGGANSFELGNATAFNELLDALIKNPETPTTIRWGAEQGVWSFKAKDAYDYFQLVKAYRVEEWIDRIQVPTWVADASSEGFYPNLSMRVAEALGDRATYHLFTGPSAYHCQTGSYQELNRVMHSWLNKVLG
ncbi:MAG: hypothetical protein LQ349_007914 [Xanthoria aureola]|nr:MAG: hypothetical protein LQ349_007914 [Xanthoria aureola]